MAYQIKVNFPKTKEEYKNGNGEGCFVAVDDETFDIYNQNTSGKKLYSGILLNNCLEYPRFTVGSKVYFEMRGENRPVAPFDYLNDENIEIEKIDLDA